MCCFIYVVEGISLFYIYTVGKVTLQCYVLVHTTYNVLHYNPPVCLICNSLTHIVKLSCKLTRFMFYVL